VFVYSSLHLLERVRRIDPARAWLFLSVELFAVLSNLLDSSWLTLTHFGVLYLIVVAESVRYTWPGRGREPVPSSIEAVQAARVRPRPRLARLIGGAPQ